MSGLSESKGPDTAKDAPKTLQIPLQNRRKRDTSLPDVMQHRIQTHQIIRPAILALLGLTNCVLISSYIHSGSPKDLETQCLWIEAAFGLAIVLGIALDDFLLYSSPYRRIIDYWKGLATRDALTGLHNRFSFMQALEQRAEIARTTRARYGVMFIDLNKFKQINDTFGHAIGDGVLTTTARRIAQVVGPTDMVARLGGDEFAILLLRTNVVHARKMEVEIANTFVDPMMVHGKQLFTSASIGTCLASDHHLHAEDLLHAADLLMYRQKALKQWNGNTRMNKARVRGVKRSG